MRGGSPQFTCSLGGQGSERVFCNLLLERFSPNDLAKIIISILGDRRLMWMK